MISSDLFLRDSADRLFDYVEKLKEKEISLNFKDTEFMNRSFAHQYLMRKKTSKKNVKEANVPLTVKQMLDFVARKPSKPKIMGFETVKVKVIQ